MPMPPAPTSPSTTDERVDFSNANSEVAIIEGSVAGTTALAMTSMRPAPRARSASGGPSSASSIASAKKRAQNPTVSTVSASTPANGPRPTVMTKMIAQIRSGTVRQKVIRLRAR